MKGRVATRGLPLFAELSFRMAAGFCYNEGEFDVGFERRDRMHGPVYAAAWVVFVVLPLLAGLKRRWWVLGIYALGCLVMLQAQLRNTGEWDDLGDFATMLVFVFPLYLIGSIVWIVQAAVDRSKRKRNNVPPR